MVPVSPFMLFDYYLMHTVSKEVVREAMNNLLARCDEVWVFGHMSLGVKVQVGIAKRMSKPVRYFDISELPIAIVPMSEENRPRGVKKRREPGWFPLRKARRGFPLIGEALAAGPACSPPA